MDDLVIDTNVLVHTQNPECQYFSPAVDFVGKIISSNTYLCVDNGFDLDESRNRSLVCHEYLKHLVFGSPGYSLIVAAASNGRISEVDRRAPRAIAKKIDRLLPNNKHDRTFANIAFNSLCKYLITHDFTDFSEDCRQELDSELGVFVRTAEEY